MKTFTFNTGRGYSVTGQAIEVKDRGGDCYDFYDTARDIKGRVQFNTYEDDVKRGIMYYYDTGLHTLITDEMYEEQFIVKYSLAGLYHTTN